MTLNEKKLLISDLCARLPYGVKVDCTDGVVLLKSVDFELGSDNPVFWHGGQGTNLTIEDDNIKPYLFPLSSMTVEQYKEFYDKYCWSDGGDNFEMDSCSHYYALEKFEWLIKNHFDYRGLIPMGLAKDATGLNIY